jgi:putative FmdB family regulatory protein
MPTYEYACDKCGHEFECEQRITEAPIKTCPQCRGRRVRRLISSTSFVLKGSGWYSDLYSSAKPDKGKAEPAEKAETGAKSDTAATASTETSSQTAKSDSKASKPKKKASG